MSDWYHAGGGIYKHKNFPIHSYKDASGKVRYVHSETDREITSPWDIATSPLESRALDAAATQVQLDALQDSLIGIPIPWPVGSPPPANHILAHGQDLSQTTFAKLFSVYGTAFGSSGPGQFYNIDLRGVFIRGLDAGAGIDPARVLASIQQDAFQSYKIRGYWWNSVDIPAFHNFVEPIGLSPAGSNAASTIDCNANFVSDGINGTPRTASETRPINIALDFIVRYQ